MVGTAAAIASPLDGSESYLSRPDILTLKPKALPKFQKNWSRFKRGQLEAAAMLLEMYPDRELYFFARDMEYLYDVARWATRNEPALSKRIHLLNISRDNRASEHLKDYLSQEGISESALRNGKKILFIDTGFRGTISRIIESHFPLELKKNFKTHFMLSMNSEHPSTRVFLTAIDPAAHRLSPDSMNGSMLEEYEQMPRYMNRSTRFAQINGKWHPVSDRDAISDGTVSKPKALQYMEDLILDVEKDASQSLLRQRRSQWRALLQLSRSGDSKKIGAGLKNLLESHPENRFIEAMVRDFIDLAQTNHLPTSKPISIDIENINLPKLQSRHSSGFLSCVTQKMKELFTLREP